MKGVVLAGGRGTRLLPFTKVINKHLLPVGDKPMIYYPIETLKDMGCDEILIVTGGEHIGSFIEMLGDGSDYGVKLTYRVQMEAGGIAQALLLAEGFVEGIFPVILGDNFFEQKITMPENPTIYTTQVEHPERFGVYNRDSKVILEKPSNPESNSVVTGLYVYEDLVFDLIKDLKPSQRGELEITDINNWYLERGIDVREVVGYWSDMGTLKTLREVNSYV